MYILLVHIKQMTQAFQKHHYLDPDFLGSRLFTANVWRENHWQAPTGLFPWEWRAPVK